MAKRNTLDQTTIKKYFEYDIKTGELTNKITRGRALAGKSAFIKTLDGYLRVCFNNKFYSAHILIWIYVFGEAPSVIDHINGDKADNRLCNLRNVNHRINCQNRKTGISTKTYSEIPGVIYEKNINKYRVRLRVDGINRSFGMYDTVEEAEAHCINMRRIYYVGNTL